MHETEAELDELDALLDRSLAASTAHLRSIIQPGERTLTARQLAQVLSGPAPEFTSTFEHLSAHYGVSPPGWDDVVMYRLRPRWKVALASSPQDLLS
jgi:hypothetical protein